MAASSGPRKPRARRTLSEGLSSGFGREGERKEAGTYRSQGKNSVLLGTSDIFQFLAESWTQATRTVLIPMILPLPSETNSLVLMLYSRGSLPKKAATSE